MALIERERGPGLSLIERIRARLSMTKRQWLGPARLVFPCGRTYPVEAELSLSHSSLSCWGSGHLQCPAEIGFNALDSNDWLTLSFGGNSDVEIDVFAVKAEGGQCRCRFEVKS